VGTIGRVSEKVNSDHFEEWDLFKIGSAWRSRPLELCSVDESRDSFQAYTVSIEQMNSRSKGRYSGLGERNNGI